MEDIDPGFAGLVKRGDIIVAGENFGCGSSREHAPIAIKQSGIACVIASSFARIFYRNAINIGLPIVESGSASRQVNKGDELEIRIESGSIRDLTTGNSYKALPYPDFMLEIINSGGLIFYLKKQLKLRSKK
jgi:3-isopropylmalate/(R)-2-methylmalate dehydratase small subunit